MTDQGALERARELFEKAIVDLIWELWDTSASEARAAAIAECAQIVENEWEELPNRYHYSGQVAKECCRRAGEKVRALATPAQSEGK